MEELIRFIKRIHIVLIFLILEGVSLYVFFTRDTFMLSKSVIVSNQVSYNIEKIGYSIDSYLSLKAKNDALAEYNARLIGENERLKAIIGDSVEIKKIQSLPVVKVAKVLKNELKYNNNFIVIDKGSAEGVRPGMSAMDENGIVGFVSHTSESFSVITSILSENDFATSAKLSGTSYTGSLSWDGKSPKLMQLKQMPTHSSINVGDTVLTTAYSNIFLENMPVGRVVDFKIADGNFYNANVETFADLETLNYVYLIELKGRRERDSLEKVVNSMRGHMK